MQYHQLYFLMQDFVNRHMKNKSLGWEFLLTYLCYIQRWKDAYRVSLHINIPKVPWNFYYNSFEINSKMWKLTKDPRFLLLTEATMQKYFLLLEKKDVPIDNEKIKRICQYIISTRKSEYISKTIMSLCRVVRSEIRYTLLYVYGSYLNIYSNNDLYTYHILRESIEIAQQKKTYKKNSINSYFELTISCILMERLNEAKIYIEKSKVLRYKFNNYLILNNKSRSQFIKQYREKRKKLMNDNQRKWITLLNQIIIRAYCPICYILNNKKKKIKKAYICLKCNKMAYCTKKHQQEHWKKHKIECKILSKLL